MANLTTELNITTGTAPLKTCDAPASAFELTIHALGVCDNDPTEFLLGNSTNDPCFYLWNTNTGDSSISFGVTTSSETAATKRESRNQHTCTGSRSCCRRRRRERKSGTLEENCEMGPFFGIRGSHCTQDIAQKQ